MQSIHNVRLLAIFNFFSDFRLYASIAILYFTHITGSFALGMSIFSIVTISGALFEIPTGIFSDRIGRRKTVILGALSSTLGVLLYALSNSYLLLAIGAVCGGLAGALFSGNNDALLYDTLLEDDKVEEYPKHYGQTTSMFQVALAISGLIGSFFAQWSYSLILWISVVFQLISVYIAIQMVEPQKHSPKSGNAYTHLRDAISQFKENRKLRLLTISGIIGYAFGEASYQFQAAFYNTLWPLWAVGVAKTLSNVGGAVSFRYGHHIIKKWGEFAILITDNLYNRVVNILAVVFPSVFSPFIMASTSLFFGVTSTAKNHLGQKEFTHEQRATMGSLSSFLGSLVFGLVAFLLGLAADTLSPGKAILWLNLFQLVNLWFYYKLFHHKEILAKPE